MRDKPKTLIAGSFFRCSYFFIAAIVGFVLTPLIIKHVGTRLFGIWELVGSFLGFYGLFDLGLSSAIVRFVSSLTVKKDDNSINRVVNTTFFLFLSLGILLLITTLLIIFGSAKYVKNIEDIATFQIVFLILGLNFSLTLPLRVFTSVLHSFLRFDQASMVEIATELIKPVLVIYVLTKGYGIIGLASVVTILVLIGYLIKFFLAKKAFPALSITVKFIDLKLIRSIVSYSIFSFINQVASLLRYSLDNFVISVMLGIGSIAYYAIPVRLIRYFKSFIENALQITQPIFSQYESQNNYESIRQKYLFFLKISIFTSLFISTMLAFYAPLIIKLWVGKQFLIGLPVLFILLFGQTIELMQSPAYGVLYGISKHKFYAYCNIIEGAINLLLSILLASKYGLIGVALGTAIPMAVFNLTIQPYYLCKVVDLKISKFLKTLVIATLKAIFVLALLIFIMNVLSITNYIVVFLLFIISLLLYAIVIFQMGFTKHEKNLFLKHFIKRDDKHSLTYS
ncbi:MAG: oligosaccharide flippase family protein [Candidatus Omnitrophota bacterium]